MASTATLASSSNVSSSMAFRIARTDMAWPKWPKHTLATSKRPVFTHICAKFFQTPSDCMDRMHRNASSIFSSATNMLKSRISVRMAGGDDSMPIKLHNDFRSTPLNFKVTTCGALRLSTVSPGTKFIVSICFKSDFPSVDMNITLANDSLLFSASGDDGNWDCDVWGNIPLAAVWVGVNLDLLGLRFASVGPFEMDRVSHTNKRGSSVSQ